MILLVVSTQQSHWISCDSILKNLINAYEICSLSCKIIVTDFKEIEILGQAIKKSRPSCLVFPEHGTPPVALIKKLSIVFRNAPAKKRPKLIFHIYGDFTIHLAAWFSLGPDLKDFQVHFLAASESQQKLIQHFLISRGSVSILPFPVDTEVFHPRASSLQFRKSMGFKKDDFIFLYAGRFSRQKEVIQLIKIFSDVSMARKRQGKSIPKLLLAGPFDDLGRPYLLQHDHCNAFVSEFMLCFNNLPDKKEILYLGCLEEGELARLYSEADCFISLSLHHDEDYGMAPLEAMTSGLPAILTAWGGYRSFGKAGGDLRFIPVKLSGKGPEINLNALAKLLIQHPCQRISLNQQMKIAGDMAESFSIPAISRKLEKILLSEALHPVLKERKIAFSSNSNRVKLPVLAKNGKYNRNYFKAYKHYVDPS